VTIFLVHPPMMKTRGHGGDESGAPGDKKEEFNKKKKGGTGAMGPKMEERLKAAAKIPPKYFDPSKSGLGVEIVDGVNTFDIKLTSN
jgi:hypothetical protein